MTETKRVARKRRKESRPKELTAAALQAFAETGFGGTTIDDIAHLAGVAKGTVYRYFDTKDDLFESVVRENISPVFDRLGAMTDDASVSASERLSIVVEKFYDEMVDNHSRRTVMRILISEGHRFPQLTEFYHNEIIAKGKRILRKILKRGIECGEFRNTPALANPEVIMGPAFMAAVWKMTFEDTSPLQINKFCRAHLDIALNGLRVHRSQNSST